jgi:DNA-binding transcriptional MerR regulator
MMTTGIRRAGEVARRAGVSTDTVRHYERKGLLPRARRSANGYREYPAGTEQAVRLIRNALTVGFTLEELARVLAARARGEAPCRTVRALAGDKLDVMDQRLADLQGARDRLHAVLADWDARLLRTPEGQRAGLLEALAGLVEEGAPPPFLAPELRRGKGRRRP